MTRKPLCAKQKKSPLKTPKNFLKNSIFSYNYLSFQSILVRGYPTPFTEKFYCRKKVVKMSKFWVDNPLTNSFTIWATEMAQYKK